MPRAYRSIVYAFPIFLAVYLAIVMSQHFLHSRGEIFPFFNWSLFSKPLKVAADVTVRVLEVEPDSPIDPVLIGEVILDRSQLPFLGSSFQKAVSRYRRALAGRENVSVELSETLVSNFVLPYGIVEYELVRVAYDPLERYATGEIYDIRVLARIRLEPQP